MIRTFRYPLLPTPDQAATLVSWLHACQRLYNGALEERRSAWRKLGKSISYQDQTRSLTELRRDVEWAAVPAVVLRSALKRIDVAYSAFFRRAKSGETPGYPRYRSCHRYNSFSLMSAVPTVKRNVTRTSRVRIPKLGFVKFKEYRSIKGTIKDVRFRRQAGKWYVCFVCDIGDAPPKVPVRTASAIDLGLKHFATLPDGTTITNPRHFRKGAALLAKRQGVLARKRKYSKGRRRARLLVAKAHQKIKRQRQDFAWKTANELVQTFDLIAHEDLQIKNMVRGNLGKSINDAGWRIFLHALACKAEEAGKHVVAVDPRGTTQRCSACRKKVPKGLSDRVHACSCGLTLDRDHNAALNILALGQSAGGSA